MFKGKTYDFLESEKSVIDLCTHLNSAITRNAEGVIYVKLKSCLHDCSFKVCCKVDSVLFLKGPAY